MQKILLISDAAIYHWLPRMKSVCIRSFSAAYCHKLWLNEEIYSVNLRIQLECGKIWARKTPNTDTFYAVCHVLFTRPSKQFHNKKFSDPFRNSENSLTLRALKKLSHHIKINFDKLQSF